MTACGNGTGSGEFGVGEITVGDSTLTVWLAEESQERRQGLRGVEELPEGIDGMFFVFPEASTLSFTMRDTLIPLDIWWFDAEMALMGRTAMVPCEAEPCTTYRSPGPAKWALETPAGESLFDRGAHLSIVERS